MDSRQYLFNSSTLTVKFGNILDTKAEIIVSSDDCDITMGGGVSGAILRAGGDTIIKDAQKMCPASLGGCSSHHRRKDGKADVCISLHHNRQKTEIADTCQTGDGRRCLELSSSTCR